jgi:hypothetical protein
MNPEKTIIDQTKKWINNVVIGCNFCPFAATVVKKKQVSYVVEISDSAEKCLLSFLTEMQNLDANPGIETSFIIYTNLFQKFKDYLDFVSDAEDLLIEKGYEGIYQVASFHPEYQFANSERNDAANYTNRSIYPMLHLLREESIEKALEQYKNPEDIPEKNIAFARTKGLVYMQMLRDSCFNS